MWKFKHPIRHAIPETRWPVADEAKRSLLFQPVRIGPLELESRTWVPAMVPWRATDDGFVTQDNLDWYRRFAEGRPGALVGSGGRLEIAVREGSAAAVLRAQRGTPVVVSRKTSDPRRPRRRR